MLPSSSLAAIACVSNADANDVLCLRLQGSVRGDDGLNDEMRFLIVERRECRLPDFLGIYMMELPQESSVTQLDVVFGCATIVCSKDAK